MGGDYPGLPGWYNVITRVLVRGRPGESESEMGSRDCTLQMDWMMTQEI